MSKRYFSASIDNIDFYGKYTGSSPYSAAKKFLNTLECNKKYNIYIKDNSNNEKIYKYKGNKIKLNNPNIVNLSNGKTITYNFNNNINRIY